MKILLGDNQFFGVNHHNLKKAVLDKQKFPTTESIAKFIKDSIQLGCSGFMMNTNTVGTKLLNEYKFDCKTEIHLSIPYPHKYADHFNQGGFPYLVKTLQIKSNLFCALKNIIKFGISGKINSVCEQLIISEIPNSVKKGNYVYLQNVMTDLALGLKKHDLLKDFIMVVTKLGYKPGFITLNPCKLDEFINTLEVHTEIKKEIVVCFNYNYIGFNVFPNIKNVEQLICSNKPYKMMAMNIFASGGADPNKSFESLRQFKLDYVVIGSGNLENIRKNVNNLKRDIK